MLSSSVLKRKPEFDSSSESDDDDDDDDASIYGNKLTRTSEFESHLNTLPPAASGSNDTIFNIRSSSLLNGFKSKRKKPSVLYTKKFSGMARSDTHDDSFDVEPLNNARIQAVEEILANDDQFSSKAELCVDAVIAASSPFVNLLEKFPDLDGSIVHTVKDPENISVIDNSCDSEFFPVFQCLNQDLPTTSGIPSNFLGSSSQEEENAAWKRRVRVAVQGEIRRFPLNRDEQLDSIFHLIAANLEVPATKLSLSWGSRIVQPTDTPDSLGLRVTDYLECFINSTDEQSSLDDDNPSELDDVSKPSAEPLIDPARLINLKFQQAGSIRNTIVMPVDKTKNFNVLKWKYAQQIGVPEESIAYFSFDGDKVVWEETPEGLEMENDDIVDVGLLD